MPALTRPSDGTSGLAAHVDQFVDLYKGGLVFDVVNGYGATAGGDIASALADAVAALPAAGGIIDIPPGSYTCSSFPSLDSKRTVTIRGAGGRSAGATPATLITYTGTGSGAAISAQHSVGVTLKDLMLLYNSASFTGILVDFRNVGGGDTAYATIEGCFLGGAGVTTAAALVALDKCNSSSIVHSVLQGAAVGIQGMTAGSYANQIHIEDCAFRSQTSAHIKNAGEAWLIEACTLEALSGGAAGAFAQDASVVPKVVAFRGNWFGDITVTGGSQISWVGEGLSLRDNECGFNTGVTFLTIAGNSCDTIVVEGNRFVSSGTSTAIDFGSTTGHSGVRIGPNRYSGVTTQVAGTIPAGALLIADGGSRANLRNTGGSWVLGANAALATNATDGFTYLPSCAGVPSGTPTSLTGMVPMVYDTTNSKLMAYIGGAWKGVTLA